MPFSGACGIWAVKDGDKTPTNYPGDNAGLQNAITYAATNNNGRVDVYNGGSSLAIPTIPAGVRVVFHEAGREKHYGPGGLIVREANVRDFGAVGDWNGSTGTDDTAAFTAAYNALGATGGTILVPAGRYLITSQLNFTKRIRLIGEGGTSDEWTAGNTEIVKAATMATTAIVFRESHSEARDFSLSGVAGNTGDGIQIRGNTCRATNVMVIGMGGNGWRIGHSDASNANIWFLDHCSARLNKGHGFYFHSDDSAAVVNANAGTAISCSSNLNDGAGSHGFHIKNAYGNTFIGTHAEGNASYGIYLESSGIASNCMNNVFLGGDVEGNNGGGSNPQIYIGSSPYVFDNIFMWMGSAVTLATYEDYGLRTRIFERDQWTLPPIYGTVGGTFDGSILSSTPRAGLGFSAGWASGRKQYVNLSGGAADRLHLGWKHSGPELLIDDGGSSPMVACQVIAADDNSLHLCSRNVVTGRVYLKGGTSLAGYLLLDHNNLKVEINENLKIVPSTDLRGFIELGEMTGDPGNGPANTCRLYVKDSGGGKTQLMAQFGSGAAVVLASWNGTTANYAREP